MNLKDDVQVVIKFLTLPEDEIEDMSTKGIFTGLAISAFMWAVIGVAIYLFMTGGR